MNIIVAQPLLLNGAPRSWLYTLLANWMEWAPGDGHGSTKCANLKDLKSAVSNAGFDRVADGLSLKWDPQRKTHSNLESSTVLTFQRTMHMDKNTVH